jgi:hypothetical protein
VQKNEAKSGTEKFDKNQFCIYSSPIQKINNFEKNNVDLYFVFQVQWLEVDVPRTERYAGGGTCFLSTVPSVNGAATSTPDIPRWRFL